MYKFVIFCAPVFLVAICHGMHDNYNYFKQNVAPLRVSNTSAVPCIPPADRLCCAQKSFAMIKEKETPLGKKCIKEITGQETFFRPYHFFDIIGYKEIEKKNSDQICVQECVAKNMAWLTHDGKLNNKAILDYVIEAFYLDPWIKNQAQDIVNQCVGYAKSASQITWHSKGLPKCSQLSIHLKYCLFKESQLRCPVNQITDKPFCDKLQARLLAVKYLSHQ